MSAQRMNNADAAWLHMDRPTNLMVVNALLWFEEPVDADRVKEILRTRLVEPFPRFRQWSYSRVWGSGSRRGRMIQTLTSIFTSTTSRSGAGDKRALEALISDLISSPLDRRKPLWDWYLVDGFGGGMAMVVRIHHCIADGIALSRVLLSLTERTRTPGSRLRARAPGGGGSARSPRRSRPARGLPRRVSTRASRSSPIRAPSCQRSRRAGRPTRQRSRSCC